MTEDTVDDVYYIDTSKFHAIYDPVADSILISDEIKRYPSVHDLVLEHEQTHRELGDNLLQQLVFEFKNDLFQHFSLDETARELRYYRQRRSEKQGIQWKTEFVNWAVNTLRDLWLTVMRPLGFVYRKLKQGGTG